jgi:hypothetical protein
MHSHILFGSFEWHMHHNFALAKHAAKVFMSEYRRSGKDFYLNYAIAETCKALKLKRIIKDMQ